MLFILAKYKSYCFETGKPIYKGDLVLYCENLKKVFHYDSPSSRDFERQQEEGFEPPLQLMRGRRRYQGTEKQKDFSFNN